MQKFSFATYLLASLHLFNPACSFRRFSALRVVNSVFVMNRDYSNNNNETNASHRPITVGLTGSIGMGKSTITKQLKNFGFSVFDADEVVHRLYNSDLELITELRKLFPNAVVNDRVDRSRLSEAVINNSSALKQLESVVHPAVAREREKFYEKATIDEELVIFYDIPLLFETRERHTNLDYTLVVSASFETQKRRVLSRSNMTEEKFLSIVSKQLPDEQKRKMADFVIDTDFEGYTEGKAQLAKILEEIVLEREPVRWRRWKERCRRDGRHSIKAILFDLDDTLVQCKGPLVNARDAWRKFMSEKMPRTFANSLDDYTTVMMKFAKENPLIAHDFTELRRRLLMNVSKEFDEHEHANEAVETFLRARSNLSPYLYSDTLEFLEKIRTNHPDVKMGMLTNGNANISYCPELQEFLSLALSSEDIGTAKPSVLGFIACCQLLKVVPREVIFVGDSYAHDVEPAKRCDMNTVLILRDKDDIQKEKSVDLLVNTENSKERIELEELKEKYPLADIIVKELSYDLFERSFKLLEND